MVDQGFSELVTGFHQFGEFLTKLFKDKYAMLFVVLLIIAIMIATLLRRALGKMPIFEGSGDEACNSQGNVIAWCISLLSVFSLGWNMRNKGADAIVNGLAGPYGYWLIIFLSCMFGYFVYKQGEESDYMKPATKRFLALAGGLVMYSYMTYYIIGGVTAKSYIGITTFIIVAWLCMKMFYTFRRT